MGLKPVELRRVFVGITVGCILITAYLFVSSNDMQLDADYVMEVGKMKILPKHERRSWHNDRLLLGTEALATVGRRSQGQFVDGNGGGDQAKDFEGDDDYSDLLAQDWMRDDEQNDFDTDTQQNGHKDSVFVKNLINFRRFNDNSDNADTVNDDGGVVDFFKGHRQGLPKTDNQNNIYTQTRDTTHAPDSAMNTPKTNKINAYKTYTKANRILRPKHRLTNSSLSFDPALVRTCITMDIIGKIPSQMYVVPNITGFPMEMEDSADRVKSFDNVYKTKGWGTDWDKGKEGGVSGRGSTLDWAQEATASLHVVINQLKMILNKDRIRMLDIPCGDMAWMARFLASRSDIDYTGMDIVADMISQHQRTFADFGWKFQTGDILQDPPLPEYDLIFSRMMMQHLFNGDIIKLLDIFSRSKSKFILMTTFARHNENEELYLLNNPGRVHSVNLEIPPFSLVPPLCLQRDGPITDFEGWNHYLALWELPLSQVADCKIPYALDLKDTGKTVYSCTPWSNIKKLS